MLHIACLRFWPCMSHISMEDPDDTRIPVWMVSNTTFIFMRQCHNIRMHSWIDGILGASHVICCVVDPNDFVTVHAIVYKVDCILVSV
jgi:hypothetical protein